MLPGVEDLAYKVKLAGRDRKVKYALGEIRSELEDCMIAEIDLMDYPPSLIEAVVQLHKELAALGIESSSLF